VTTANGTIDEECDVFGQAESLCSFETLQFADYDKVVFNYFDPETHRERRRTVFLEDCRKASALGARLAQKQG